MDNLNIGIIIQARTGSTRFPQKLLKPFCGKETLLDFILTRFLESKLDIPIIVATTTNENDGVLVDVIKKHNSIHFFRGDEENVLNRFISCANEFSLDNIIRICSDNPFLDIESIINIKNYLSKNEFDYVAYFINNIPSIKTHFGFWGEGVSKKTLMRVKELEPNNKKYYEHVTNYIYENEHSFHIKKLESQFLIKNKNLRFTIDTKKDYEILIEICKNINKNNPTTMEIIEFVEKKEDIKKKMLIEIKKNTK